MIFNVLQTLLVALACTAAGLHAMHILQAQRYQIDALVRRLGQGGEMPIRHEIPVALCALIVNWYLPVLLSMAINKEAERMRLCGWITLGLFLAASALVCVHKAHIPVEKPFKLTHRMLRLILTTFLVNLGLIELIRLLSFPPYVLFALSSYVALLCAFLMRPLEDAINARYYAAARRKIAARDDLICIGVTGSYGKSEVKQMLKTILSERFRVLATPPSFSTAMGIARVVNDQLEDAHQIFIAEMGAQHRGEIREMAKLARPKFGVLTCISDAHLDTFGSIEAVAQAKSELLSALPKDGVAFFGADLGFGDRLWAMRRGEKYRAGIGAGKDYDVCADHIETGVRGTRFELTAKDGSRAWAQTRLLGSFSVRNLALSAAVAMKLGMRLDEIAKAMEKLRPFKHRLQLIPGDVNVIDDSANANHDAAVEALKVLADFPGRRVLVTGGFADAEDQGYDFGTRIPGCADYVILIGTGNTRAVMSGLMTMRFQKSAIRMVNSLDDAAALVHEIARKGDTVLYEGIRPLQDGE